MNRVDGKVALVTGAGRGIGAGIARRLAEAGAKVVVSDLIEENGHRTVEEIGAAGGDAHFVAQDVTDEAGWESAVAEAEGRFGALNILVNNAGVYSYAKLEEMSVEDYRRLMDVNVMGVFLGIKYAFRSMKDTLAGADAASIVNISSVAGLVGSPLSAIYSASKGAVRLLTKSAALEAAQLGYNIRVNSVHPGLIETDMADQVLDRWISTGMSDNAARQFVMDQHPIKRLGGPVDIAAGVLFLASPDSAFMTGAELVIDGGWTAR